MSSLHLAPVISKFLRTSFVIATMVIGSLGCDPTAAPKTGPVGPISPVGPTGPVDSAVTEGRAASQTEGQTKAVAALRDAVARQDWRLANSLGTAALLHHPNDADVIELVARAAHGDERWQMAADLMVDACRAERFTDPDRARRAMATLLAVGRIHDCIELLEPVIAETPDEHGLRRMLYQMCWGVEDRPRSLAHGRYLVQHRQFDVDLLLEISVPELRTESSTALVEMADRSERDQRPLIAEGRVRLDRGDYDGATQVLRQSLRSHPEHAPSLALLSRAFAGSRRWEAFVAHAKTLPRDVDRFAFHWLAKGDWSAAHDRRGEAVRAYWEACSRDADLRIAWLQLSQALKWFGPDASGLTQSELTAIDRRVVLLSQFSQATAAFVKSSRQSQKIAIEIAQTLEQLGRLWEAEAWASIATTLPNEVAAESVTQVRQAIIGRLRRDTPWQDLRHHEELRIDLSHLPLPSFDESSDSEDESSIASNSNSGERALSRAAKPLPIRLVNEATDRGLTFFGRTAEDLDQPGVRHYQTLGCGGGTIDFDLDGWSDVYLAAAGGTPPQRDSDSNALWRNQSGHFTDVTSQSASVETGFGQGIAVGDFNEDGFPDLLVLNYGPNTLFLNNGDGTFTDASERIGLRPAMDRPDHPDAAKWSSSGAIADLNGDGLSDLTILNYGEGADPVTRECLQPSTQMARACSPLVFPGTPDQFLFQSATGHFTDGTSRCGSPSIVGRGLGIVVGPFEPRAGIGIFVANDLTSNHYWTHRPESEWALEESAIARGLASDDRAPAQGSMGIASGDFDRDGDLDLYVTNFGGEANTYHAQAIPGLWRDQTTSLNLDTPTFPMVGFGTEAIDIDGNGNDELVVLNGHVDDYPSESSSPYAQPMQVFQRHRGGTFESIGETIGGEYLDRSHVGRALWTIDANRDGMTDVIATHQTEPVALLINQTEQQYDWIEIKLVGAASARDAIGATLELIRGDERWVAFQCAGDGYLCSNERILRFGLGKTTGDCSVMVTWPDGTTQTHDHLSPRRQWLIVQTITNPFELAGMREN